MSKKAVFKSSQELKFGKVTYLSQNKGAFVELITKNTAQMETKEEVFVPQELIQGSAIQSKDQLVQLVKDGEKIVNIKLF